MSNSHLFEKYKTGLDKELEKLNRYDRMCMGAMFVTAISVLITGFINKDMRDICVVLAWLSTLGQVIVLRKKLRFHSST